MWLWGSCYAAQFRIHLMRFYGSTHSQWRHQHCSVTPTLPSQAPISSADWVAGLCYRVFPAGGTASWRGCRQCLYMCSARWFRHINHRRGERSVGHHPPEKPRSLSLQPTTITAPFCIRHNNWRQYSDKLYIFAPYKEWSILYSRFNKSNSVERFLSGLSDKAEGQQALAHYCELYWCWRPGAVTLVCC